MMLRGVLQLRFMSLIKARDASLRMGKHVMV